MTSPKSVRRFTAPGWDVYLPTKPQQPDPNDDDGGAAPNESDEERRDD